jgi:hypothetical protein
MTRGTTVLTAVLAASTAAAQQPSYQQPQRFQFSLELLARQEWTTDLFDDAPDVKRWRLRALPRLEIHADRLVLGVGGDFNYSKDENPDPLPVPMRDNYLGRDGRLDLAFARLEPAAWLRIEAGRFEMPVGLTEMIWDRDLRPQGGAATLTVRDRGSLQRFELTALGARGSHVFEDGEAFGDGTTLALFSVAATFSTGPASRLQVVGSFLQYTQTGLLDRPIRRQNAGAGGVILSDYDVVDVVARLRHEGQINTQLVADYCRNTAADADNTGLWLALVLGSTESANGRVEYTYAKVDRHTTLAAYATDDFFWGTGWEGHRVDIGLRASDRAAFHAVGQLQRFKDSARAEEREHWVKRLRLELRVKS